MIRPIEIAVLHFHFHRGDGGALMVLFLAVLIVALIVAAPPWKGEK